METAIDLTGISNDLIEASMTLGREVLFLQSIPGHTFPFNFITWMCHSIALIKL